MSSALHAMGLSQEERFHRYHRVLSRASWSSREVSRVLLGLLVEMFVPEGDPLVVGIDETSGLRFLAAGPMGRADLALLAEIESLEDTVPPKKRGVSVLLKNVEIRHPDKT